MAYASTGGNPTPWTSGNDWAHAKNFKIGYTSWLNYYGIIGDVFYVFFWDRYIPEAEMRELALNPWQMFKRKTKFALADVPTDVRFAPVPRKSIEYGFNFRATPGFVQDGQHETYVLNSDSFPTERKGLVFGYSGGGATARDRNSSIDRRLAGMHFVANAATNRSYFRIKLPEGPGVYEVRFALGDAGFSTDDVHFELQSERNAAYRIFDFPDAISSNQYWGADEILHTSPTAWVANNQPIILNITSSILTTQLASEEVTIGSSTLAHLSLRKIDKLFVPINEALPALGKFERYRQP